LKLPLHRYSYPTGPANITTYWLVGGLPGLAPSKPKILNMPTVKPYFKVSNMAAIGAGCGFGPQMAMPPMIRPQSAVSATAETKIRAKRSLMTLSRLSWADSDAMGCVAESVKGKS
jgi:hypothetical protein